MSLDYDDIISFVNNHVEPLKMACALNRNKRVMRIGVTGVPRNSSSSPSSSDSYDNVHVRGLVLRTCQTTEPPYDVDMHLRRDLSTVSSSNQFKIVSGHCDCIGGASGKCKNCVAVLTLLTK